MFTSNSFTQSISTPPRVLVMVETENGFAAFWADDVRYMRQVSNKTYISLLSVPMDQDHFPVISSWSVERILKAIEEAQSNDE